MLSLSALPLSEKWWLPLHVMSLCNKKVFIKMRMPYFKSQQMDSLLHFLRFVQLLLALRDKRNRVAVFLYHLKRTWRESLKQTTKNKQTNKEINKTTATEYFLCVLSSHFNAAARGGVSYHSYSSQSKTISQGQYQGSAAI
jgi:hypothetical protein